MTAREILDGLSETLVCDERILSLPEKELLANVLQRISTCEGARDPAVTETIAQAIGEVIAQRAAGVLGNTIARQLLRDNTSSLSTADRGAAEHNGNGHSSIQAHGSPKPPSPSPPTSEPTNGRATIYAHGSPKPPSPSPPTSEPTNGRATIYAHGSPKPPSPSPPTSEPTNGRATIQAHGSPKPPSPSPPTSEPTNGHSAIDAHGSPKPPSPSPPTAEPTNGGAAIYAHGSPKPPSPSPPTAEPTNGRAAMYAHGSPKPPSPSPPTAEPTNGRAAMYAHGSPKPPSPSPPTLREVEAAIASARPEAEVAVLDMPQILPARFAAFDEFLAPFELDELLRFTAAHEADFQGSEVVTPGFDGGKVDFDWRRSSVLTDLGAQQAVLAERIQSCLPVILEKLGLESFPASRIEAQITASNDGDYFRWHTDNGHPETASRAITFVYFFHREPSQFQGGELRLYDAEWHDDCYYPLENHKVVVPKQNRAVFFVSALPHEVTAVECPSGAFADSRFTLNGWLHR